ncbi:MAG TPA: hypothetical protein VH393_14785 [Ktedonobacterales bacterium]
MRTRHNTATTRRRWLLLALAPLAALALSVALTLVLVSHASAAPVVNVNIRFPISGTAVDNPCTVGVITLSGEDHLMGTVTDDHAGGVHAIIHQNAHLTGMDEQGNVYIGNDTQENIIDGRFDENGEIVQETDSLPLTVELIGQGGAPNFTEHVTAHVTLNADGTITAEVIDIRLTCH